MLKKLLVLTSIATISLFANTTLEIKNDGGDTHTVLLKDGDHSLAVNKNWIGIYKKGASNAWGNVLKWSWIKNLESLNLNNSYGYKMTIKDSSLSEGSYESRFFLNNSYNVEKRAGFTIGGVVNDTISATYNIKLSSLEVVSTNKTNKNKTWIGIYKKGSSVAWKNVLAWQWQDPLYERQGSFIAINNFKDLLLDSGDYEARLFYNNSFNIAVKSEFKVDQHGVVFNMAEGPFSGDIIFNVPVVKDKTWIGIYKKGASNVWSNVVIWTWVKDMEASFDDVIEKVGDISYYDAGFNTEALIKLDHHVDYEARLFYNNSYNMEASIVFQKPSPKIVHAYLDTNDYGRKYIHIDLDRFTDKHVSTDWIAIIKKGDERIGKNVKLWAYADINNENFDLSVGGNYYWFFRDLSKIEDGVQYEAVMFANDSYKVITSMDMSRR